MRHENGGGDFGGLGLVPRRALLREQVCGGGGNCVLEAAPALDGVVGAGDAFEDDHVRPLVKPAEHELGNVASALAVVGADERDREVVFGEHFDIEAIVDVDDLYAGRRGRAQAPARAP